MHRFTTTLGALVIAAGLHACAGNASTTNAVPTGSSACTLAGDARIHCAPGVPGTSDACTTTEPPTVRETLTCVDYAATGDQRLDGAFRACATETGAACCACAFELDAVCTPCETND